MYTNNFLGGSQQMRKMPYRFPRKYTNYEFYAKMAKINILQDIAEREKVKKRQEVCVQRNKEIECFMKYVEFVMQDSFTEIFYEIKEKLFSNWIKYGNKPVPQANQQIITFLKNSTNENASEVLEIWQIAYEQYRKI